MDGLVAGAQEALDRLPGPLLGRRPRPRLVRAARSSRRPRPAGVRRRRRPRRRHPRRHAALRLRVQRRHRRPQPGRPRDRRARSASACSPATPRSRRSTEPAWRAAARARATRPPPPRSSPPAPCASCPSRSPLGDTGRDSPGPSPRRTLGAWLVKASPGPLRIEEQLRTGFAEITSRCVRPTYRAGLVGPGPAGAALGERQRPERHPAGIYACGHTTGHRRPGGAEPGDAGAASDRWSR